jgi:hypothetical protein
MGGIEKPGFGIREGYKARRSGESGKPESSLFVALKAPGPGFRRDEEVFFASPE